MDNLIYLDCDGVILNTMDTAYANMKKMGLDINDSDVVHEYFINVNWNNLIKQAGVLNDSIDKIKFLRSLGYNFKILTTCVNKDEPEIKRNYFFNMLPCIEVITVPWKVNKSSVVRARGNVLIDDSRHNITDWNEARGQGILFNHNLSDSDDECINDLLCIPKVLLKENSF